MSKARGEIDAFWKKLASDSRPTGAFWKRLAPDGREYLLGRIRDERVVIRENPERRSARSPDYWVLRDLSLPVSAASGAIPLLSDDEKTEAEAALGGAGAQRDRPPQPD